jgi:hypothetical protein
VITLYPLFANLSLCGQNSRQEAILDEIKPEAAYFVAEGGHRSAILFVNMDDASQIPAIAEPWFLAVNGTVEFQPVMKMEDLLKAGPSIEKAVKKFG